jgi:hypothetical protein
VLLLDAQLEPLTIASAVSALPRLLTDLEMNDARASVWDLARLAGWRLEWADDLFSAATLTDATGTATFSFDEFARITDVKGTLTGAESS